MTIIDKVLEVLGKRNIINNDIFIYPEKYYLRLESLSFIIVVRKENNEYINIYDTPERLKKMVNILKKHPRIED